MTQAVRNRWRAGRNSATRSDVTFVRQPASNLQRSVLYFGSPFVIGGYTGPTGAALCGYVVHVPTMTVSWASRNEIDWPVRDPSLQFEQVHTGLQTNSGSSNIADSFTCTQRHARGPFTRRSKPNSDMVSQYFQEDETATCTRSTMVRVRQRRVGFLQQDARLQLYTSSGGEKKTPATLELAQTRGAKAASDFRSLFALVDATQAPTPDDFTRRMESVMDVEEFLRVIAFEHVVGNWDSFGYQRGKNMSAYKPRRGKWSLLTWDIDFVLSAQGDPPDSSPFWTIDPTVSQLMYHPPFQRVYFRASMTPPTGRCSRRGSGRCWPPITPRSKTTASLPTLRFWQQLFNRAHAITQAAIGPCQQPFALSGTNTDDYHVSERVSLGGLRASASQGYNGKRRALPDHLARCDPLADAHSARGGGKSAHDRGR